MAMPEQSLKDPLELLPKLLNLLSSIQKKPTLAASVFSSVRNAFRSSKAQPYISPLLPPLTVAALTSPVARIRRDAAQTCATLLRALVSRRFNPLASAYIDDLVALGHRVINSSDTVSSPCQLPRFCKLADTGSDHTPATESNTRTLPVFPESLEAVLHLLSLFLPVAESQPSHQGGSRQHISQVIPTRLWVCMGTTARTAILDLASSYSILSGRCGEGPSHAAANLLEKALDPSSIISIPAPCCQRIRAIVEAVLCESFPPNIEDTSKRRRTLYHIAQLASSDCSISAEIWTDCGIQEAFTSNSLGEQLTTLSKEGMVQPYFRDVEEKFEDVAEEREPPMKKRRLPTTQVALSSHDRELSSVECSQLSSVDLSQSAVRGLQRTLQSIESIYVCLEDPASMQMLGTAAVFTADALNVMVRDKVILTKSFRDWVSFSASLSLIMRDLSTGIQSGMRKEIWVATLKSCEGIICLVSALQHVQSLQTGMHEKPVTCDLSKVTKAFENLLLGLGTILEHASKSLETTKEFPTFEFGEFLVNAGDLALTQGVKLFGNESLQNSCIHIQDMAVKGDAVDSKSQATLIRGSMHILFAVPKRFGTQQGANMLPSLTNILLTSLTATPDIIAATALSLADVVCIIAGCRTAHGTESMGRNKCIQEIERIDVETWEKCFDSISSTLNSGSITKVLIASLRCLGALTIHSPLDRISRTMSILTEQLWRHDSQEVHDIVFSCIYDVLRIRDDAKLLQVKPSQLMLSSHSTGNKAVSDRSEKVDAENGIVRMLQQNVSEHMEKGFQALNKQKSLDVNRKTLAVASVMRLAAEVSTFSNLGGMAIHMLLSSSAGDFTRLKGAFPGGVASPAKVKQVAKDHSIMAVWLRTLRAISRHSGYFDRVSRGRAGNRFYNERRLSSHPRTANASLLTLPQVVTTFVTSKYGEWLPSALQEMLHDPSFTSSLASLLTDGDVKALWLKVPRHAMEVILKAQDRTLLDMLASNVNQEQAVLMEKVSADTLTKMIMSQEGKIDTKRNDLNAFVSSLFDQSLEEILSKRAGKIVQKLVMEFGTSGESRARRGLISLSKLIHKEEANDPSPDVSAGALLSKHFMLVMDAVNRGLFHSKASSTDRFRYLRMLEVVISMTSEQLHLFVPKILATLKLALHADRGNEDFRARTLEVWIAFLKILGAKRMVPHLGSVLSTLLPFYGKYNKILAPSFTSLIRMCTEQQINNHSDIALLLRVTDHDELKRSATILEASARDLPSVRSANQGQLRLSVKDLAALTKSVKNVIVQLENGTIEVMCTNYLLSVLKQNRNSLHAATVTYGKHQDAKPPGEVAALASVAEYLVDLLTRTRNDECQKVLLKCIGEVGALDPTLVREMHKGAPEEMGRDKTMLNRQYPHSVHALVATLLDDFLVPTLTKGELQDRSSSRQNRVGLVIQELLRICGCKKDTAGRSSKHPRSRRSGDGLVDWDKVLVGETADENAIFFWENLRATTRNVVEPYLDEPFDVQHYRSVFGESAAGNTELACQPVWARMRILSTDGKIPTAQEWLRQMIVQLVDFIGQRGGLGSVLKALRPVLRYEDDVSAFIFPLVVATTLDIEQAGRRREVSDFLEGEMAQVLEEGSSPQPLFDILDTLRVWRDQRCVEQARVTMVQNPGILGRGAEAGSGCKKVPLEAYAELEKDKDVLSTFVDLNGRESRSLSLFLQARSAFRSKSFSRAVMMAESYIRNMRSQRGFAGWASYIDDTLRKDHDTGADAKVYREMGCLQLLQKAFAELEDAGNMRAITALRGNSSLAEQVLDCEAAGRYGDALTIYERAIASQPSCISYHGGFLGCLRTLGHWESMLSHAKGLLSSSSLKEMALREAARSNGIAAAWRLGRWTEVEEIYQSSILVSNSPEAEEQHRSWQLKFALSFGKMLLSLRDKKHEHIFYAANEARDHLLIPTIRAAKEGYTRTYPMIALLHSISDIEDAAGADEMREGIVQEDKKSTMQSAISKRLISLTGRTESSKSSLSDREPLISVKRVCYEILHQPNNAAKASLELALLAKEGNNLHAASASVHRALSIGSIDNQTRNATVLEMAHIQRAQGDCSVALNTVKVEIERLTSLLGKERLDQQGGTFVGETSDRLCTALVLAGCWIEETRSEPSEIILSYFDRAATYAPSREEPFYALGRHYDSLLQASASSTEKLSSPLALGSGRTLRRSGGPSDSCVPHHSTYVPLVIKSFAQALRNGHTRIFEALPRILAVWLDYQTELDDPNAGSIAVSVESDVKQEMKRAFHNIPGYMWMTAVPQVMSRILHPRKQVREDLTALLARLVCVFPDQCFWTILPSSQLKTTERKRAAADILNQAMAITKKKGKASEARESSRVLRSRIQSALSVVTSFVGICMSLVPKEKRGRRVNCSREFMELKSYLQSNMMMNPIIPNLDSLTTRLPIGEESEHRPYETDPVRIVDIEDHVLVMVSLMRPRRIGLVGSDGRCYKYLAKKENQGDMRKDSRLVELITVVNRLLAKNSSSRDAKLGLKIYAVLPLTEETGMIEWVNDLAPLRNLVRDEHSRMAVVPDTGQIQNKYRSYSSHKRFLEDWAFVKFPPVLDRFFLRQFGQEMNAETWLTARNLWTESTAVWSMVGYIVGLGDRHGENVLLETTSGRCVHVDFAMLFDKGLKLKVPEIVPFRLTRNMVTAMGIAGYEGVYRGVSEKVLGMMRRNADAILGVLESFLHDPLADWSRSEARVNKGGILATKEAWQTRAAVKAKLMGMVDNSRLPLSIEGQVQRLIQEATNIDNLSEMYLWWSAWI